VALSVRITAHAQLVANTTVALSSMSSLALSATPSAASVAKRQCEHLDSSLSQRLQQKPTQKPIRNKFLDINENETAFQDYSGRRF
jgi:hypothetical protein